MTNARPSPNGKRPIVLVHGAWHGAWCWRRVCPLLRAAGHEVHAISLTGLGDRAHMANPDIGLDDHINDITTLFEAEEIFDAVLVGHSYGGMVITGVGDRMSERLRRLVYLNAFVPEDGKSLVDYLLPVVREPLLREGNASGMVSSLSAELLGVVEPSDVAWLERRLAKQSYRSVAQPIRLTNPARHAIAKTFVKHTASPVPAFDQFIEKFRGDPQWRLMELQAGANAMITNPAELTEVILKNVD